MRAFFASLEPLLACCLLALCSCSRNDSEEIAKLKAALDAAKAEAAAAKAELAKLTSTKPDGWQPDPTLLDQLAPAAVVEAYEVRPPKGYGLLRPPAPPGGRFFFWMGPQRFDPTGEKKRGQATFGITLSTLPPAEAKETTLEKFLDMGLGVYKERLTGWSQRATERGQINGLSFLRVRWSGVESTKGLRIHGFKYMTQDGQNYVGVHCDDVEPYHVETLKLAETAAHSFRKR